MYEDKDRQSPITMTIPPSSKAVSFVEPMKNRSGFMRVVLEDFLKINGDSQVEDYINLPETERLEKFFNTKKSRAEVKQSVLKDVNNMKSEEKGRLAIEMDYIAQLQKCGEIFLEDLPLDFYFLQFAISKAKILAENGVPYQGVDHVFYHDIKCFMKLHSANKSNDGWSKKLIKQERSVSEAEKLFALLANHWFGIEDIMPGAKALSREHVVNYILDYMEKNPDAAYMDSGYAVTGFTKFLKRKIEESTADSKPAA